MDESRFDELSRALGDATTRRAGLKAALGALLGGAAGAAALEAEAKRRRDGGKDAETDRKKRRKKKCKPACADGQSCVKGACVCDNGGPVCGANCCAIGQRCEGGQCVSDPQPGQCIAAGEPCKATGRACCDGRVCASGQGGEADVACYVAKTGACASTADCVYGMSCRGGVCSRPEDADGLGTPCSSASQQACSHPGAVCTPYTGAGAPNGAFCTLPLQRSCSGDPECTCYKCWYSNASPAGTARSGRASANTRACCHVPGQGCGSDGDCCLGLSCVNGTCAGTMCVPDDQPADMPGCDAATPCCNPAATCTNGTCTTCGPATCPNGCCRDGVCQPGDVAGACGTGGATCAVCTGSTGICHNRTCQACNGTTCPNGCCQNGVCEPGNTASACGSNGAACTQCAGTPAFCHSGTCSQCAATFEPTNDSAANGTKLQAEWNKRKTDSTLGEIVLGAGTYSLNPLSGYGLYWNEPAPEAIAVKACAGETVTIVPSNRTTALVGIPDGKVTLTGLTFDGQSMTTVAITAGTNSASNFEITLNQCSVKRATQGIYAVGDAAVSKFTINGGTYCPDAMAAILTPTCTGSPVIGSCTAIIGASFPSGCGCQGTTCTA